MPRPRTNVDAGGMQARVGEVSAAVWRETGGTRADLFDDATVAALAGGADAMKAKASALAELEARFERLPRRVLASKRCCISG